MDCMEVRLHIDFIGYKEKPSVQEVRNTLNRRVTASSTLVTPEELASKVAKEGKSLVLGLMKNGERNKANLIQQQVLALDFDNTIKVNGEKVKTEGSEYQSLEETLEDDFIKENASFIYKTFNHSENWERFRVVFILDEPIETNEEVAEAYSYLMDKYPNADKSTKDSSRIFFGGNNDPIEVNYNNILAKETLGLSYNAVINQEELTYSLEQIDHMVKDTKVPTWKIISDIDIPYLDKIEIIKKRWEQYADVEGKGEKVTFSKDWGLSEFVRQLPMDKLLGVGVSPFINILEYEKNPSAGIWVPKDSTTYLYTELNKQGENGNNRSYDIIQVVAKLLSKGNGGKDCTRTASKQFLAQALGVKVEKTPKLMEIEKQAEEFQAILLSDSLKKEHPEMYQVFGRYNYTTDINAIIDIFKANVYEYDGEVRSLSWGSIGNIALRLDISKNKAENLLNLMSLTGISNKLSDEQLPEKLLTLLKTNQEYFINDKGERVKRNKKHERRSSVYELNELETNFQKLKKGV